MGVYQRCTRKGKHTKRRMEEKSVVVMDRDMRRIDVVVLFALPELMCWGVGAVGWSDGHALGMCSAA